MKVLGLCLVVAAVFVSIAPASFAESEVSCSQQLAAVTGYAVLTRMVGTNMFYLETQHEGKSVDLVAFPNLIEHYSGETFRELGLREGSSVQVTWDAASRRVLSVDIGRQAYITRIAGDLIYARVFNGDTVGESVVLTPKRILKYGGEKFSRFGIRNGAKFRVILDADSKVKIAFF